MTNTITYNGKIYSEDVISEYYDQDIMQRCEEQGNGDAQALFDEYINIDPDFAELFDYDLCPLEEV